jgi:hypothetical protein
MFPSMNIQIALPFNNYDDNVRIESTQLAGNEVLVQENDVLLGRGGKKNQHSGNENLRLLATKYSSFYRAALKRQKPVIALLLVRLVQSTKQGGR